MEQKLEQQTDYVEGIFLRYWPQISFRVRKSIGFQNPEWEDICSEILYSVIKAIREGKFREESSIGTFIYSITTNKVIDYIRKKGKKLKYPPDTISRSDPYLDIEKKEQAGQIVEALNKLKSKHADIMYLYYYMGIPQNQIGKVFDISPGRVNQIIKSALEELKYIISTAD